MKRIDEWVRTCLKKKKLKEAWADSIIKRADTPLRKYHCPHCFGWHVTSKRVKHEKDISKSV
mgnify:CR=1 FL=1